MSNRQLSFIDRLIGGCDKALRTLTNDTQPLTRPSPAKQSDHVDLTDTERKHSIGLMRVNHTGEVCAQALYQGQGLTAKLPKVRSEMEHAAAEEQDHLAWCEERIVELGGRTSLLNPVWYSMSFSIGAIAGLIGDKVSLGFVAATEEQVCQHLNAHLNKISPNDVKSRAIISQMLEDEAKHAQTALDAGGLVFPAPIKQAMSGSSQLMTKTSFYI